MRSPGVLLVSKLIIIIIILVFNEYKITRAAADAVARGDQR